MKQKDFHSFKEFWPFYMSEHVHSANRRMHFLGTLLVHILAVAWIGHLGVEKNKPVAARYPIWSLIADFKMFYLMLLGKIK